MLKLFWQYNLSTITKINTITFMVLFFTGKSCTVCLPEILKSSVFHSSTVKGNFVLTLKYEVYFLVCLKKNYDRTMSPSFSLNETFFF